MSSVTPDIAVIICTKADSARSASLKRAIASVLEGAASAVQLIVVINGGERDPHLVDELVSNPRICIVVLEQASFSAALLAGRRAVQAPAFCFLDDDDEYLAGAVDARVQTMLPTSSVLITNGLRRSPHGEEVALRRLEELHPAPLAALFRENWLPSCGGVFKTANTPIRLFEDLPKHVHWTWIAFQLTQLPDFNPQICDEPHFVINDTPGSASKSFDYSVAFIDVYSRMLTFKLPSDIRQHLRSRLAEAWHGISDLHLKNGRRSAAFRAHLKSLALPGGLKYIPYTRHLLLRA